LSETDDNRDGNRGSDIEASWAPADPRDKLYDDSASGTEKSASAFRIFASFHPVLNLPVLLVDSFRQLGAKRAILLWFLIATVGAGGGYFFF